MKIVAVIPARYESSRFQGKPLADLEGKPMIWWTYQQARKVEELDEVYVATDDERIYETCKLLDMNVIMTSNQHLTGTDRVAEVAEKIFADIYLNIQGDEPLIEPETIRAVIPMIMEREECAVANLMTKITNPVDVINCTIPKVITNEKGKALMLTRAVAPYPRGALDAEYYKQVCVYAFRPEALRFFAEYGKTKGKAKIERIEDIEILRFIENDMNVYFAEVETASVAVDTVKDMEKVRSIMRKRKE